MNEPWTIEFYRDARGREPVARFIESLDRAMQARVRGAIEVLRTHGTDVSMPLARPVTGFRFWELRVQSAGNAARVFYFAYTGRRMVLLHAYIKKTQRAPRTELELAARRMDDYLSRGAGA